MVCLSGQKPLDPPTALDVDRVALFGFRGDLCPTPVDFQVQAMAAVPEGKRQSAKRKVNPLEGTASLDVCDIGLQHQPT
jgi:hypothetical protein